MRVKELKALLKNKDEDLMVVTDGYNYGFDEVLEIKIIKVKLNANVGDEWYGGRHVIAKPTDIKNTASVLCIGRGRVVE